MIKVLSLRYSVAFQKAFSDPEVFTAFVKDILGLELEIDRVEVEKSFMPSVGHVKPRFDLFAEDHKNRVIVDIQHVRDPDYYDRFLYYHCAALMQQVAHYEDYVPRLKVYTLVVLTSSDKHQRDVLTLDMRPRDLDGVPVDELNHKIIYFCPKHINDKTPVSYRLWMQAINDSLDGEIEEADYEPPVFHKLFTHIRRQELSPEELSRVMDERSRERQFDTGHEIGLDEGLEQGAWQATRDMAQQLRREGLSEELILKVTGLSVTELRSLPDAPTDSAE